jgi:uncharacterized membrane-anchored protein YitT (DUF2179 family)
MTKTVLNKTIWEFFKEYALITLGLLAYSLGWTIFLLPNNLVGGGVSGFSAILFYATGIPMGYTYFVLNVILLLIALKILGTGFGGKTVYAIVMTSVCLNIFPNIVPHEFIEAFAVSNGKFICAVLGGIIAGVGIGISISQGGSTGGTDIIALIWCKFRNASPGRVILIIDVVIILTSLLVPSYTETGELLSFPEKLAIIVYGLIMVTVCGYAVDVYLSGTKQSVQALIFTKKYEEMADAIAYDMKRGVTVMPAKGWFTKEDTYVVMVVTRKNDLNLLLRYVKSIDPDAFLSVSSVMGVYGKGFDAIKVKSRTPKNHQKD